MLTYRERIEKLCAKKLADTAEKRKVIGYMDFDDSGMILPPPKIRKVIQAVSGSGVLINDVVLNNYQPKANHPDGNFYGPRLTGENFGDLLKIHPVYVDPLSGLAGAYMVTYSSYRTSQWKPELKYDDLKPLQQKYGLTHAIGALQHMCQDDTIGLKLGWKGIAEKIRHYAGVNPDKADFYAGLSAIVEGMQSWIIRNAREAEALSKTQSDPLLAQNLVEIAAINDKLVTEPPTTFREAIQWINWYGMGGKMYHNNGSLGRLDVMLLPYYLADKQAGILSDEEAIFYLACHFLRDTSYLQVGGYDEEGNDVTNPVSYLILEAVHWTKIPSNIGVCVGEGIDRHLLRRGVELQFEDKCGNPRFVGIQSLVKGLVRDGMDVKVARSRSNSGCHWSAIPGREYCLQDCIKVNFGFVFDVALHEMVAAEAEPSIELLWDYFARHLRIAVEEIAKSIDFQYRHQHEVFPEMYLDLLCYGPIEKGLDCSNGGVEFYNFGVDGAALAIVADSFGAIQRRICEQKLFSFSQLVQLLDSDWSGAAGEKARMLFSNCDKYGKGGSVADEYAVRISAQFSDFVIRSKTPDGHNMIPGLFSWAATISMGQKLGATPNGRKAGQPISHGANPCPGFREDGAATAMSNAIVRVQPGFGNTAPMQIELEPSITDEKQGIEMICALIEDHFNRGGTLINLNIIDADTILKAHQNPEAYPQLVVRVTGFSAYFANLSPEFRQLVVDRILDRSRS